MKIDLPTGLAFLTTAVVIGISWQSLNSRLDEGLTDLKINQAEPLCLSVLTTQVKLIGTINEKVKAELAALNNQFCPKPTGTYQNASFTRELSAAEKTRQLSAANDRLAEIINDEASGR